LAKNSVEPKSYCPDRGDIIWIDFDPHAGREQAGRRPAIVLSPRIYNQRAGLCVVCPMTSHAKGYPFEVPYPQEAGGVSGGVVLADQVKSMSWVERDAQFAGPSPGAVLSHVLAKVRALIAL
jgi:mRNA interferase MazF